jgi:hypothetical protein
MAAPNDIEEDDFLDGDPFDIEDLPAEPVDCFDDWTEEELGPIDLDSPVA